MLFVRSSFLYSFFIVVPGFSIAGIDSGGGLSSDGFLHSHSSIGAPFAAITTQGDTSRNHPGLIEVIYPVTPSSVSDIDENGFPDGWEIRNFGFLGVDTAGDADLDGTSNLMEYLAGTNPKSASSLFRPQGTYSGGLFLMPVPTMSGRSYKIWVSSDLQSWTLQRTLTGDGNLQIFEFEQSSITSGQLHGSSHPSSYFFRVQISIPPVP